MGGDFVGLCVFFSAIEKTFNLEFSEYISISLAAEEWKIYFRLIVVDLYTLWF